MTVLTLRNLSAVPTKNRKGMFYTVDGTTRAARHCLDNVAADFGGTQTPSGQWLLDQEGLINLIHRHVRSSQ